MQAYLTKLRAKFPHKTEAELELMCSNSLQLRQRTGLSAHEHRKRGMEKLFPRRVWQEWREDRIASVQECLENRILELSWMGSASSGKSRDMADVLLTLWWTNPEVTSIYIASPYKDATERGLWTDIKSGFFDATAANPGLPGTIKHTKGAIELGEKFPKSFIEMVTVDAVGKLVGKKAPEGGLLVLALSEMPAFTEIATRAVVSVLHNLRANQRFLILGDGNFAHSWDLMGIMCDPNETDIPGGYARFKPDEHFRWRTKRNGLCLRFDGLRSPNVLAGYDKYEFLTRIAYIEETATLPGGLKTPEAMRYIRSAPVTTLDDFTVTNDQRIRAGGAYDPFEWTTDAIEKGCFIDPGFGGDACVLQKFQLGYQRLVDGGRRRVLALWDGPHHIPVQIGLTDESGREISATKQIVAGSKAICQEFQIPVRNVGFDGSLRADIVQEFAGWSLEIQAIDSNGTPTDRPVSATEKHDSKKGAPAAAVTWKERADRLLSEFWFATASLIDSFQLKNLHLSAKAASQLSTRRWDWQGKSKKRVETKAEYKENLRRAGRNAESPNEADAVVGCVEMARRMGLGLDGVKPNGGSASMIRDFLMRIRVQNVRSYAQTGNFHDLPAGRPKYMAGETDFRGGRLHQV